MASVGVVGVGVVGEGEWAKLPPVENHRARVSFRLVLPFEIMIYK